MDGKDGKNQWFTIDEAIDHIGRHVRVVSDVPLGESNLPVGLAGEVRALRPAGPSGYSLGVAWGGRGVMLTYFSRIEYEAWLEEINGGNPCEQSPS